MKKLLILLTGIFACMQMAAQTEGMISYKETIKFELELEDESLKDMIPESQSVEKEMLFTQNESLYQNKKGEVMEGLDLKSDDGSFHIKIQVDDTEDIWYKSFAKNEKVHQRGMMGKSFVVKDVLGKNKWKITNEKVKYLDYECQKAVIENEDEFIIAWFTPQIPVQAGPAGLHGLPGLIVMANYNDGEREIKALKIDLRKLEKGEINIPKDGKKVNEKEFEKIRIEKEKEMDEMYGGKRVRREIERN